MNKKERLELANWAVAQARKAGADDVAVDIVNQRDIEIEHRNRQLDKLKESTQNSLSLTIYANHRYSSHSTNDIRKDSLGKFISEVVGMTKYLSEDEFRSLPDPKYYAGQKDIDLEILDRKYENVTSEQRVKIAKEIEDVTLASSDNIISCTAYYSDTFFNTVKVHSNGFKGEREGTSFGSGVEVTVRDGDRGRPEDWEWRTVRFNKDLASPDYLGKSAARRALGKIGQTKMESGVYDMVIENRAASRLLYSLRGPMGGRALQQKSSFLEGKLGEKIASDKFTVIDDPFIKSGLGSRLYDGEGMATKRRVLIEKGVLKSYYIGNYYGKKLEMEPTIGSSTNTVFEYGTRSAEEMIKDMKKGFFITGFIGGNSNSTTGDFSYGITGKYVEDGKIIQPVNEMNISGSLIELWNQLIETGNDPYIYSSMRRPSLYFKDIQFSGI
ncbi:MAG: TldD/PmbA family protein [candidate division Zixibacteria bacterium]|nr:TldD/PmbA family protein [candidate division Zixibacteria bacterium]